MYIIYVNGMRVPYISELPVNPHSLPAPTGRFSHQKSEYSLFCILVEKEKLEYIPTF